MATIVIAKNITVSNIIIEDLGIEIPSGAQIDLTEFFEKIEIGNSDDLDSKVSSGNIVINDGTNDLSITNGLKHINFETEYEDSVFGTEYKYAESEEESSTILTSWQEKLDMQVVNIPSGSYRIGWSFEWSFSRNRDPGANYGVHIDWGAITLLELEMTPNQIYGEGAFYQLGGFGFANLNAGNHKIALNYHASSSSLSTAYIRRARLEIWRVN